MVRNCDSEGRMSRNLCRGMAKLGHDFEINGLGGFQKTEVHVREKKHKSLSQVLSMSSFELLQIVNCIICNLFLVGNIL